jgi:Family of unknown function (DUF6176)
MSGDDRDIRLTAKPLAGTGLDRHTAAMSDEPPQPATSPFPMPASVPSGMQLELSRARLLPGAQQETERWMQMLHDRYDECLDTLGPERMAFEATFRHTDSDGTEWIYHLSLFGDGGSGLDLSNPVDAEHLAYAMRCKARGWEELRPVLMLAPRPILANLEEWARTGELGS